MVTQESRLGLRCFMALFSLTFVWIFAAYSLGWQEERWMCVLSHCQLQNTRSKMMKGEATKPHLLWCPFQTCTVARCCRFKLVVPDQDSYDDGQSRRKHHPRPLLIKFGAHSWATIVPVLIPPLCLTLASLPFLSWGTVPIRDLQILIHAIPWHDRSLALITAPTPEIEHLPGVLVAFSLWAFPTVTAAPAFGIASPWCPGDFWQVIGERFWLHLFANWFSWTQITKGSLGYLSSMYFSTSLVLGEVGGPFPEIESRESRTET